MKRVHAVVLAMFLLLFSLLAQAQQIVATNPNVIVPPLVNFSGALTDSNGKPVTGSVVATFSVYSEQTGGAALWMESQTVQADNAGHYTVMLGATSSQGLPPDLFSSGPARWLGVELEGEAYEQPRVLLVAVPYALKAQDAQTVGGFPASAFVMSNSPGGHSQTVKGKTNPATETQNFIPLFTNSSGDLGNSILVQSGTTEVGINTTTPSATLEVNGTGKFDGLVGFASSQTFPGTLTGITAGTGITVGGSKTSPTIGINASFADEYYAQLKAPNTFTANQSVNGTMTATTFSGSGSGLTNVNASLLGGLSSSAFAQLGAASNTFTGSVAAKSFSGSGSGLTNVTATNSNELGGLAASAFAQLAANNTFSGTQTINNTTYITGSNGNGVLQVTGSSYEAIVGTATDMSGTALEGVASATTGGAVGVAGTSFASAGYGVVGNGTNVGVLGDSSGPNATNFGVEGTGPNVGVYGAADGASLLGAGFGEAGVWGDTGAGNTGLSFYYAILGTANNATAGYFWNNSNEVPTLYAENDTGAEGSWVFATSSAATDDFCFIDIEGDLGCSGTVSGVVNADGGARKVSLYAIESPENWFEDAGSGQLANGSASIAIDPTFAQTVNTGVEYHVFLTPKGDCEGLYVSNETPQGFEVHELRGGHSGIGFDYRIMAKRVGYENLRLADVTERYQKMNQQQQQRRERMQQRRAARSAAGPIAAAVTQAR
jgi:hypothetical protein